MLNKKIMKRSLITVALVAVLTLGLMGCGSGDEGVTSPGTPATMGVFLDAEVEGLTYQSGDNPPAVTDENGTFEYTPGEPLSFSVGGVELGTLTDGAVVCTPNDFIVPENIARFLQSLDADNDPTNGIDVSAASAALVGQTVSSDVFENTSSSGFAADPAIQGAISAAGTTLLDPETTNTNLRDGTDNTFDPAELAGLTFVISDPLEAGLGFITFDSLLNPSDRGSTGSLMSFSETVDQGGEGIEDDFAWNINTAGVMTLTFSGEDLVTVKRSGGSSRAISITLIEMNMAPRPISILKLKPLTETDLSGAPITQGGTFSRVHEINSPAGSELITFNSDGTMSATGSSEGPWSGTWSAAANFLTVMDGNEWSFAVLLDGSVAEGGSLLIGDTIFNGFGQGGVPDLVWQSFFFVSISPVAGPTSSF
jgi:hypothetical protein